MPQPPAYTRQADFTSWEASNPSTPKRGEDLDAEFDALKVTTDGIRDNLELIQRDDGALANESVHPDAFDGEALALVGGGWTPRGNWATGTLYEVSDAVRVTSDGKSYVCAEEHTSGTFATDLAAGKWILFGANAATAEDVADIVADAEAARDAALAAQTAAETAETNAETAASAASTSASNASTSATNAATAETNAETAETNAEAAQAAAEAARDAALAAQTAAELAETNAETAETNAETAAASAASAASAAVAAAIGVTVQGYSAKLAAVAALTWANNKGVYLTGTETLATFDLSSYGRGLLNYADEAAFKAGVNLEIGVDVLAPSGSGASLTGILKQGLTTIYVPASAMISRTTNGAAAGSAESSTNKVMSKSLDFDTTTQEFAQFSVRFPKNWDEGTVTFEPIWTAASGSGGVVWALQGVALSNDDALDTAYGTEQTSTDTLITANDVHVGPASSAITIAGTPAAGDWVSFQIKRNVSNGSDTLGVDARLLGVALFFTTNAADDA